MNKQNHQSHKFYANLGMSDEFGMTAFRTVNNQYFSSDTSLACSNETATKIDKATITLIKKAHDEAYQIIEDNKMKLHELAKFLYERETIIKVMYILNKPAEISTKETYPKDEDTLKSQIIFHKEDNNINVVMLACGYHFTTLPNSTTIINLKPIVLSYPNQDKDL